MAKGKLATPICCLRTRNASISDLREIYDIEVSCFEKDAYPFDLILYYYILFGESFIVIECINKVVGYAIGVIEHRDVKCGHIISIAVHPLYQGLGLGKILLKKLEEVLCSLGAKYIYLEVRSTNTRAINLYKSLGYVVLKKLSNYYGDEDGLLMIKYMDEKCLS